VQERGRGKKGGSTHYFAKKGLEHKGKMAEKGSQGKGVLKGRSHCTEGRRGESTHPIDSCERERGDLVLRRKEKYLCKVEEKKRGRNEGINAPRRAEQYINRDHFY